MASASEDVAAETSPLRLILLDAEDADFEFIIGIVKNPLSMSADRVMDVALAKWKRDRSREAKQHLAQVLEREILYAGSADLAYFFRWTRTDDAGVRADELLNDVAAKLSVKTRTIGPFVAKLQRLVRAVVEKEFLELSPEEQRALFASHGIGVSKSHEFVKHLRQKGPLGGVPLLMTLAGREAAEKIATALVVRLISIVLGKQAAAQLIKTLAVRFPWWAQWMGPAAWFVTSAWVAIDIQGPAYRKTIPLMLYLGLLTLRERSHKDDFFFEDA